MKILVTGGHLSPALAVIDELLSKKIEVLFVGRKYNLDSEKTPSLEYKEIARRKLSFHHISAGRFTRIFSLRSFFNIAKIPIGFYNALWLLRKEKPDLVLSFGGYIAFPIATAAWLFKIPVYTHEQTIHPGLANRIIGLFAKKIFIAFESSKKWFPEHKTLLTGNPVRSSIRKTIIAPFRLAKTIPTIYITGGSLGSHSVNILIERILTQLVSRYIVIHQTGNVKNYGDYHRLTATRKNLPVHLRKRYFLAEHFFEDQIGYVYSISDLVISRAGANTFFELLLLKKPAILIPLPWSAHAEQLEHAQIFHKAGVGEIFHQSDSPRNLLSLIDKIIDKKDFYLGNFVHLETLYKENAAKTIVREIL